MKLGVIISTSEPETVWNALRFANFSLKQGDVVKVFLMGLGVDYQSTSTEKFNTSIQAETFLDNGGSLFACGTCIKSRQKAESDMCPLSTMQDMYDIVTTSDKVVTF